jgi:O-succinylbenzoate synthase
VKDHSLLVDDVCRAVDEGYKRIKVKIRPGSDVEVVAAIRDRFADLPLMVDANSAYALKDIDALKALDRYDLMMIEQPLGPDDIVDHAKLQQQMETPICLDESILSAEDARKAAQLGSCKVINIKPGRVGGLAESLKILEVCKGHGVGAWVGGMLESGLGRAFLDHLAAQDGISFPGDLTPGSSYLAEDITEGPGVRDGTIVLGDKPGIGLQIKEDVLDRYLRDKTEIAG